MTTWADYPTDLAKPGHIPRAGEWEALLDRLALLVPTLYAIKTVDETISSNATLQNDDHLFVTVEPNATYAYKVRGAYISGATPDFRAGFSAPSGTFTGSYFWYFNAANASVWGSYSVPATALVTGLEGAAANRPFELGGTYTSGATGGILQFQWSQDVSNASNTTVYAGTDLTLYRTA